MDMFPRFSEVPPKRKYAHTYAYVGLFFKILYSYMSYLENWKQI